ncbi:hypothetical protein BH09PAT2_BH09PAT2_04020 [soil metagenome]
MLNNQFFQAHKTLVLVGLVLISAIILVSSYMIQTGQFTFLNRASGENWVTTDTPPPCTGTWKAPSISKTVNSVDISESYTLNFTDPTNVTLFDWDNDPKPVSGGLEIGHIFTVDGVQYKVPNQDPNNDEKWSTVKLTGVKKIVYSRNEDSGGSNVCATATTTKSPTPGMSRTPSPSGQICKLDTTDIILVLDRSGSMSNFKDSEGFTKLDRAKQGALNLLDKLTATSNVATRIGLVSFGSQGNDGTGRQSSAYNSTLDIAPTTNFTSVKTAINNLKYIQDGTCIECGIRIANGQLTSTSRNRVVILLSDGGANHIWDGTNTSTDSKPRAIAEANKGRATGIKYYVLGYGSNPDTSTLVAIAGNTINYKYQPDAKQWPTTFIQILDQVCQAIPTPSSNPTNTPTKTPTPKLTITTGPTMTRIPTPTGGLICKDLTANIMLVLDRSSSMNEKETDGRTKLEWVKEASQKLVDRIAILDGGTIKVGVASFGSQGNDGTGTRALTYNSTLHIAPTTNLASVKAAITNVKFIESGTCIECGIRIGNNALPKTLENEVVILLSDGRANHNWEGGTSDATARTIAEANKGRTASIEYYVLGYGSDADESTLKSIAGPASHYQYKPNASDWPNAFLTILDQICETPIPTQRPPSPTPTKTPTPQPTNEPTNTPTPSPTKTPTPTNTPQPSNVPSHTPTPTIPFCAIPVVENVRIKCPFCN